MGCNCGKNKRQAPTTIPHQPPKSDSVNRGASTGAERRDPSKRRRFSVVGGEERASFASLGEAREFQRQRGGRLR